MPNSFMSLRFCALPVLDRDLAYLHHPPRAHVHAADSQEEAGKGTLHRGAALQRLLNLVDMTHIQVNTAFHYHTNVWPLACQANSMLQPREGQQLLTRVCRVSSTNGTHTKNEGGYFVRSSLQFSRCCQPQAELRAVAHG